jgi:hypothetical protein
MKTYIITNKRYFEVEIFTTSEIASFALAYYTKKFTGLVGELVLITL